MSEEYKPWLWKAPEGGVIGRRRVRRLDGYEKASGTAVYTRDVIRPGMLYAKLHLSPYAHAKIKKMDTSRAEAQQGVRAVLRYDDPEPIKMKPANCAQFGTYDMLPDTAHYNGQPVGAMVVGDSEAICDRALRMIEIEWEQLPVIVDWDKALEKDAPLLRAEQNDRNNINGDRVVKYGDADKGLADSAKTIEFSMYGEENNATCVEPHACVAEWRGDYLEIWYHGQHATNVLNSLAAAGYTSKDKITINTPYMGSQFGGLNWSSSMGNPTAFPHYAVAASRRTGKPVKALWDESTFHGGEESNGSYKFKVGFQADGKINAVRVETVWAGQAVHGTIGKLHEGTAIPNLYLHEVIPYLSRPSNPCAKDGAGACAVPTLVFNQVAAALGIDPTQVALLNDGCDGEIAMADMAQVKAEQGFNPNFDSLRQCIAVGKRAIDWDNKWHPPGARVLPNGNYHGIGFMATVAWRWQPGQSTIGIMMRDDGTANILAQAIDCGVSAPTAYSQVVASELGLKYGDVTFRHDKDMKFATAEPAGSLGGQRNYPAMARAARKLKQVILEHAVKPRPAFIGGPGFGFPEQPPLFPDCSPNELDIRDSMVFKKANPSRRIPVADVVKPFNGFIGSGTPFFGWDFPPMIESDVKIYVMARQCYFTELEVEPDTGMVEVTRLVVVNDVGKAINPDAINGQQYGGAYMGIGRSKAEAVYFDPHTGVKLNDNHIGYPILTINDLGPIDCHILESGLGYGAYGVYGCGESGTACTSTITAPGIYNAIGKWITDFPTTPDRVLRALGKI